MKYWSIYCAFTNKLAKFGLVLSGVCVVLLSALVGVEVILRNFFETSTLIADEYAGYFCVGMTFLGGAFALESGSFIKVDLFYMHFKGRWKLIADYISCFSALAFLACLLYFCTSLVVQSYQGNVVSIFISRTPLAFPQSTMIIGIAIMMVVLIRQTGDLIISSIRRK